MKIITAARSPQNNFELRFQKVSLKKFQIACEFCLSRYLWLWILVNFSPQTRSIIQYNLILKQIWNNQPTFCINKSLSYRLFVSEFLKYTEELLRIYVVRNQYFGWVFYLKKKPWIFKPETCYFSLYIILQLIYHTTTRSVMLRTAWKKIF